MNSDWSAPAGEDVNLEPLHDRIVLEKIPEPDGLIILTDKPPTRKFKVLAVGPGKWRDGEFCRTDIRPGDVVILPGVAVTHPDYETKRYILAQEADIGAKIG
jgi:co-chaperonin GroES (HSP10)